MCWSGCGNHVGVPAGAAHQWSADRWPAALEQLYPGITQELFDDTVPTATWPRTSDGTCRATGCSRTTPRSSPPARAGRCWSATSGSARGHPERAFHGAHRHPGPGRTPDHSTITGVKVQRLDGDGAEEFLEADFVVDATGRGSRPQCGWRTSATPGARGAQEDRPGYVTQHLQAEVEPVQGDLSINWWPTATRAAASSPTPTTAGSR